MKLGQRPKKTAAKPGSSSQRATHLEKKSNFAEEVAELGKLLTECMMAKEAALQAYGDDALQAEEKVAGVKAAVVKAKTRREQLLREHDSLRAKIKQLKKAFILQGDPNAVIDEASEFQHSDYQFRILRKLNQDSAHALNQLKEAVMDAEEYYD